MLDVGGQDATEAFEDVGHSDEAREILEGLLVGTLKRQVFCPLSFPNHPKHPGPRDLGRGISHGYILLYPSTGCAA